ncbi:hypothetical protein FRC10_007226 [Ceratobasidium sp. 414]|nr:hypothetical protein FRC10_007226 [Ceratobasidium sp. 414]
MALTEAGKIHCDISAYNLLLINPDKHYRDQDWLKAPKARSNPEVWDRTAKGTNSVSSGAASGMQAETSQFTCPRLTKVKELKRGPVCVVHDTEFTVNEDRPEGKAHTDRTGTPAFISAQLLQGFMSGETPVTRTFIHDVESLLWVLIWVLAHRSQKKETWRVSQVAEEIIQELSRHDLSKLGRYKRAMLADITGLGKLIRELENDWCEDLAPVICGLADYLYTYLYFEPPPPGYSRRLHLQAQAASHEEFTSCSRSTTFTHLLDILDGAVTVLDAKRPKIDFRHL